MPVNNIDPKRVEGLSQTNIVNFDLTALLKKWRMNHQGRKELASLPDFMLKDLGISRNQIEQEYQKPFCKNCGSTYHEN